MLAASRPRALSDSAQVTFYIDTRRWIFLLRKPDVLLRPWVLQGRCKADLNQSHADLTAGAQMILEGNGVRSF